MEPLTTDLRRALDESAVRAVVHRYAEALDRGDWDGVRACYHPDAVDHRAADPSVEGLLAYLRERCAGLDDMAHLVTTQVVDVGGDTAHSVAACLVRHRRGGRDRLLLVRYHDRLERRDGAWRISERRMSRAPDLGVPAGAVV